MQVPRSPVFLALVFFVLGSVVVEGCVIDRTQQSSSYLLRSELDSTRDRARDLEKDLLRERQRIDAMQHKASDARKRIAESGATLESFLEELTQVRGELSGLSYSFGETGRYREDLDMRISGLELRFVQLEMMLRDAEVLSPASDGAASVEPGEEEADSGESTPVAVEDAGPEESDPSPPEQAPPEQAPPPQAIADQENIVVQQDGPAADDVMFQRGLVLIKERKWDKAGGVLQTFLKTHPDSRWHLEAMYLLGECLFNLGRHRGAIRQYQKVVDRDESGEWAARAMFKQGLAFAEMGTLSESTVFLSDVVRLYPKSPEAEKARQKLEQLSDE
jgi:tol-pal system protein YbgF